MIFMHRHGRAAHHAHGRERFTRARDDVPETGSLAELRRWLEELEVEITRLEDEQPKAANDPSEVAGTPAVLRGVREGLP
jgi:hypothetical protein